MNNGCECPVNFRVYPRGPRTPRPLMKVHGKSHTIFRTIRSGRLCSRRREATADRAAGQIGDPANPMSRAEFAQGFIFSFRQPETHDPYSPVKS